MIILIPIGGIGQRFKDNGYTKPKALINLYGKSIISYLLDNLNIDRIDYIFIPYNKEYKKYRFEEFLIKKYPKICFKFHCLENNTRGAAETIDIGINNLNEKKDIPVICLDCDNWYTCDIISQWNGENCIFSFEDVNEKPIYSYVKTSNSDEVIDIKEKDKISNKACTGAYGFKSINELKKYTSKIIINNITQKNEFYTSGVIKNMLDDGYSFKNITIDANKFICLGTPLQLKLFYNNFPRKSSTTNNILIKPKRFCFDLDNTLVTFPTILNDYTSVKPILKNINFLKYLKSFGNIIIIYTARRMKTHNGNIGKINADIGKITFETLEKFDIPYDEIYFGKPYADFYIDDLALSCFDNLEKKTGYYNTKIKPRDFHFIEEKYIATITKKGNLNGENYYYKNIPNNLKDLFPLYFTGNDNSFTIEKIKGVTVTDIYLSKLLKIDTLIHILNSIVRIQKNNYIDDNNNIYDNYATKLIKRYNNYDYSLFKDSKIIYENLLIKLQKYEKNNCGKKTIIHGDPVFSNIIINNYDKIKFIDMRGKLGNNLSICGDWLYDWSKIYQSLIGYDEILLSKTIDVKYKQNMIETFKKYFIDKYSIKDFENLKIITKSLIFTLIPLHNNEKCNNYYNLLFSNYFI
jgi:capsule biosynthesis phosphatase